VVVGYQKEKLAVVGAGDYSGYENCVEMEDGTYRE
jgi:hypothetical protein